ncbi:hypothetical protein DFH09DRAFT_1103026 [Mycena vulgaris]|nr:hypothetical protein DFH09DRAFT_1103026 [Mycena vulgaris]
MATEMMSGRPAGAAAGGGAARPAATAGMTTCQTPAKMSRCSDDTSESVEKILLILHAATCGDLRLRPATYVYTETCGRPATVRLHAVDTVHLPVGYIAPILQISASPILDPQIDSDQCRLTVSTWGGHR